MLVHFNPLTGTRYNNVSIIGTAALTIFTKAVARERRIPFELKAISEYETRSRAMETFERIRVDAAASVLVSALFSIWGESNPSIIIVTPTEMVAIIIEMTSTEKGC